MSNGKGDTRRPTFISREEEEAAWARTFGAKKDEHHDVECTASPDGYHHGRYWCEWCSEETSATAQV